MTTSFVNKLIYNFDVWPEAILGADWKNVTILGTITSDIARTYSDIDAEHARVYPYLPTGTVNDSDGYEYILVKTSSGTNVVLGIPWIKESSIEIVEKITATITVSDINTADIEVIRATLVKLGHTAFTIKTS